MVSSNTAIESSFVCRHCQLRVLDLGVDEYDGGEEEERRELAVLSNTVIGSSFVCRHC